MRGLAGVAVSMVADRMADADHRKRNRDPAEEPTAPGRPQRHGRRIMASPAAVSSLQIDLLSEPRVQVDLELRHLLADRAHLIFEGRNVVVESRRRRLEHLLRLLQGHVEESVTNLVSVPIR